MIIIYHRLYLLHSLYYCSCYYATCTLYTSPYEMKLVLVNITEQEKQNKIKLCWNSCNQMKVKEPITFYSVGAVINPHDCFADYHYYFYNISLLHIILERAFFYGLPLLTNRVLDPTGNVTQSASMIIHKLTLSESITAWISNS